MASNGRLLVTTCVLLALASQLHQPANARSMKSAREREWNRFRKALTASVDFSFFVEAIDNIDLTEDLKNTIVKNATNVTIFVPSDNAFNSLELRPRCERTFDRVGAILNHVVTLKLPAAAALAAPVGTQLPTLGKQMLRKVSNSSLAVGLKQGNTSIRAKVISPDLFKGNFIIAHGIDTLLTLCSKKAK